MYSLAVLTPQDVVTGIYAMERPNGQTARSQNRGFDSRRGNQHIFVGYVSGRLYVPINKSIFSPQDQN